MVANARGGAAAAGECHGQRLSGDRGELRGGKPGRGGWVSWLPRRIGAI